MTTDEARDFMIASNIFLMHSFLTGMDAVLPEWPAAVAWAQTKMPPDSSQVESMQEAFKVLFGQRN